MHIRTYCLQQKEILNTVISQEESKYSKVHVLGAQTAGQVGWVQ